MASAAKPFRVEGAVGRAEHISLEAETELAPNPPTSRRVRAKYALQTPNGKCKTELSLLDEHYLQVRIARARRPTQTYSLDLRFLNSQPVRVRHIAWGWFILGVASALASGTAVWFAFSLFADSARSIALVASGIALLTALSAVWLGMRATSESLNFKSVHGGATLVSIAGALGSTKQGKAFFVAMIKEIAAAKAARPQNKQQWLRDEMREHHRLRELGVLSEAEYEASKARILRAHA
jgi:hypothetical protein